MKKYSINIRYIFNLCKYMEAKISELNFLSFANKKNCSPKISLRYFDAMNLPYMVSRLNMFFGFTPPRQPFRRSRILERCLSVKCYNPTEATTQHLCKCIRIYSIPPHRGNHGIVFALTPPRQPLGIYASVF